MTDVYYVISRSIRNAVKAKEKIITLTTIINVCDTTITDTKKALALNMGDFEDAVIAAIAKRERADYIVTRNLKDFAGSPVPALSPSQVLKCMADRRIKSGSK